MQPIEFPQQNTTFAKDQPQYSPLPGYRAKNGIVTSCWKLSIAERIKVFLGGKIYLSVMTFNKPLQPLLMETKFNKYEDSSL